MVHAAARAALGSLHGLVHGAGCQFDSAGSFDPDGTIANYSWVFGDGTTASGPAPTHTYAIGGLYDVALTVTDNAGARDVIEARILANRLPTRRSS